MEKEHQFSNDLILESSPYLLQHAHNPVQWHAWNEATLALAKKENKLLLISIGYTACHWCHVMEHECFEDTAVASVMNKYFINVKVDREERPDIDQVYMNAVQLLTGSGGWPLNCVALPDGRPIWGGTYFPKKNWVNALSQLAKLYTEQPEKAEQYAADLTKGIRQSDIIPLNTEPANFTKSEIGEAIKNWLPNMDFTHGGRDGSPKFPLPNNISFLLRYAVQANDSNLLNYVNTTLTQMAYGGIYDQIGGGFARYSVDDHWHIPHFEKMLYDNAQLVSLYATAYLVTKNPLYKKVVEETTTFIERELYHKDGVFYSSLDADSKNEKGESEEGAFYVWNKKELQHILGDDFKLFSQYYNINSYGEWEHGNYNLIRTTSQQEFCTTNGLSIEDLQQKVSSWKNTLLKIREKRSRPELDDKSLCSWNALMLKAYVNAYAVFDDPHYLDVALKNAHFIVNEMTKQDGSLYRNFKNGKSNIEAYLEDYAGVADAFICLYEVTLDEAWLSKSKQLTDHCFDHFYDTKSHLFFFTSDKDAKLITRKIEIDDNVISSSNSIMANNLFKLGHYYENKKYNEHACSMLNNMKASSIRYGAGASNWLNLYLNYLDEYYEIAISGSDALYKVKELNAHYLPNKLVAGSTKKSDLPLLQNRFNKDETNLYLCVEGSCKRPVKKVEDLLKQVKTKH
jgi:uncharacterized protein YyaL (SSP411 family)